MVGPLLNRVISLTERCMLQPIFLVFTEGSFPGKATNFL